MKQQTKAIRWSPDLDNPDSVDDMFAKGVDVHLERMDNGFYCMIVYETDGTTTWIDIVGKHSSRSKVSALVRR